MESRGVVMEKCTALFQNLEVVQNGQHQTNGEVQANQTTDSTDNDADQRDLRQNTDQCAGNSVNHQMNDDVDHQSGNVLLGLECQGEKLFVHIHEMCLLNLDEITASVALSVRFCNM